MILYAARRPLLRALGGLLVVDDHPRSCDAIVLMNGNISTRAFHAAELHRRTGAPVLMARLADTEEVRLGVIPNITDATRELLIRLGVPEGDITVLSSPRWIAGTHAEALLLCPHIRGRGWRRVAIVTDAFHTRRARWTFRRVMGDGNVEFLCAATSWSLAVLDRWWRSEYGLVHVVIEYVKFLHYRRAYRSGRPDRGKDELPPAAETRRFVAGYADGEAGRESDQG